MEEWKRLEFEYAQQLRTCDTATRRQLYDDAYTHVAKFRIFRSDQPEDWTAGTSKELVDLLAQVVNDQEHVLEVGCGRGYTCLMLAPHVKSIIGTDVAASVLTEASAILKQRAVKNAAIKNVSAFDLCDHFGAEEFHSVISIEVVEHLHPEDAEEHFRQVFQLLKPGGKYIIVMPNRLNGPHDITRGEFPALRAAIGFHLNESTYSEIAQTMRKIGYNRFRSFHPFRTKNGSKRVFYLPYQFNVLCEILYKVLQTVAVQVQMIENFVEIRLVAYKP